MVILKCILVPINNDLERRIADAFEVFDHAGNKTIDVREIATIIRGLGCCPSEAEVQEIIVAVEDPQTPGSVHLSKFLPYVSQIITEHKYQPASPEQLLQAFQTLDQEGHGYLTKEYISTLMTQDGEPFTQDELDEMLEIAIDPHTQTVPYEYYINQLMVRYLTKFVPDSSANFITKYNCFVNERDSGLVSFFRFLDPVYSTTIFYSSIL
ncbi:EF-hand calcium-binding domain-containing protein 2 isoform X2 [Anoplophora glabripennis]|uniref:EF-hand calcium-binding domain-containing protein 2 isoform X2 n=1 Tax=Anoplophora glabripennis TaxID=217634 RepID=UPI000C7619F1|nr:EF-hand calcium-binding domain-containing protein 2 isoform X2 [Anoplophora glabripennis]